MDFYKKIEAATELNNSLVCVGLDPDLEKFPDSIDDIFEFNRAIVDATKDLVCAYKPNSAFYEAHGANGIQSLKDTMDYIKKNAPEIPVILDFKRADIGNTNSKYIEFAFKYLNADAVTVNPYMGSASLQLFLDQKDKGVIILCRTSNTNAGEFQDLQIDDRKLYQIVAQNIKEKWNTNNNCCLVAGATSPDELTDIRTLAGDDMLLLVPGIGAQGGDIEKTVKAGVNSKGSGIAVNSSRGIIYASNGDDFAEAARQSTIKLRDEINKYR